MLLKKKAKQKKRQAKWAAKANEGAQVDETSLIPTRAPNELMPVRRRVTSSLVATVGPSQIQRDLQVEVMARKPLSKPLAFRWYSENRRRWFLPCMAGVENLILGDSQCKDREYR